MKNMFLPVCFAFIAVSFFSCKKESTSSPYFLKAKVDDKWVTYSNAQFYLHPDPADPSVTEFQVYAGDQLDNINISIQSSDGIGEGTYNTNTTTPYQMNINAFKDINSYQETYGINSPGTGTNPYYVLTITSYSADEIRGTIIGNFLYNAADNKIMNLTDAEFVVKKAQ